MLAASRVSFIGSGTMGEAMISGILARRLLPPEQITASDPINATRERLTATYGVLTTSQNELAAQQANILLLCIKPQIFPKVLSDLRGKLSEDTLVLSIMAGVSIATIRDGLQHSKIVRSIPNTPAQVGKGMSVWTATADVTGEQRAQAKALLDALGEQIEVTDEVYVDMATSLSGSGPGFVLLLIEAMIDAGVQMGINRADATKMVLQTFDGTVELVRATALHPVELRNRVTSAGGTTAAGLFEMEAGNIRATLARAILAAYGRSQELGGT